MAHLEVSKYVVLRIDRKVRYLPRVRIARFSTKRPTLMPDELAICLKIEVPEELFQNHIRVCEVVVTENDVSRQVTATLEAPDA